MELLKIPGNWPGQQIPEIDIGDWREADKISINLKEQAGIELCQAQGKILLAWFALYFYFVGLSFFGCSRFACRVSYNTAQGRHHNKKLYDVKQKREGFIFETVFI